MHVHTCSRHARTHVHIAQSHSTAQHGAALLLPTAIWPPLTHTRPTAHCSAHHPRQARRARGPDDSHHQPALRHVCGAAAGDAAPWQQGVARRMLAAAATAWGCGAQAQLRHLGAICALHVCSWAGDNTPWCSMAGCAAAGASAASCMYTYCQAGDIRGCDVAAERLLIAAGSSRLASAAAQGAAVQQLNC